MKTAMTLILGLALSALLTGCFEPTKPAGPGGDRQQPYSPDNGHYK
jgi:hypothetical protein